MLSEDERRVLEGWANRHKTAQGLARRARIVLKCATVASNAAVARQLKTRTAERRVTLPARCVQPLKLHHEQQKREREAAGTAWQHDGHVFITAQGGPIDPTNLTRAFNTLLRRAGLRRIRFHDLRHSTATLLLEQGGANSS